MCNLKVFSVIHFNLVLHNTVYSDVIPFFFFILLFNVLGCNFNWLLGYFIRLHTHTSTEIFKELQKFIDFHFYDFSVFFNLKGNFVNGRVQTHSFFTSFFFALFCIRLWFRRRCFFSAIFFYKRMAVIYHTVLAV